MSCPIKSGKEFKLLQSQLGSEEAAIYVWKALGEDYPSTLMSTSDLKKELGIKTKMSNDQIVALAKEVKRYNKFNSTSHSFSYTQFADTTDYLVSLNISYLPVKREITRLELFEQNPTWTNMPVDIRKSAHLEGLPELGTDFYMGDQALKEQEEREDISFYREGIITDVKSDLNEKLISFLSELGVSTEEMDSLRERTGYSILGATDLLTKTMILNKDHNEKAIPKEAAYLIFEFLGRKNILRKDLIASIHLLEDYAERFRKYEYSNLSEYKKNELIVIDYLHEQLINNFDNPVKLSKTYESKDATAKNKFEYLILSIKKWWNEIIRKYFKSYKRNEIKGVINQISQDILNKNYRLFATTQKQTDTPLDGDAVLAANPKMKKIFDKLKDIGLVPSGSYALSKQGTVFRKTFKDLDFTVPYDEYQKGDYLDKIKKAFPNVVINTPYGGIYNFAVTQTIKIDGLSVDLFVMVTPEEKYTVTEDGVQDWVSIFDAKVRIGNKKHLNDLFNWVPNKTIPNFKRGLRHYNFDWNQSNFNYKNETTEEVAPTARREEPKSFSYPVELVDKAREFLTNEGLLKDGKVYEYTGTESEHFQVLMSFHKGNFNNALVDFYKTFSEDFNAWYGHLDSRFPSKPFKFGNPLFYNKPSIFQNEDGGPKVLYHGAGTSFDAFNKDYFLAGEGAMAYGAGFYGTTNKPTADQYAQTSKAVSAKIEEMIKERDAKLIEALNALNMKIEEVQKTPSMLSNLVNILIGNRGSVTKADFNEKDIKNYELLRDMLGIHETKHLYIHLTNPLDWFAPIRPEIKQLVESAFGIEIDPFVYFKDNLVDTEGKLYEQLKKQLKVSDKELSSRLYQIGIDGTIHFTKGGTTLAGVKHDKDELHFVIFEPIQAKAVNNSGLFSKDNANMFDPVTNLQAELIVERVEETQEAQVVEEVIEPSLTEVMLKENPQTAITSSDTDTTRAREIASKLSAQLGLDYSIVTPQEARELTKDAKTPWNGEKAFFIGGRVYFVGDALTTNLVLHEFSHPLVRAIAKENRALFDNLYKGLKESAEGREIIQEVLRLYPELNELDPLFKEEVIVRAIEKQGTSQFKTSTGFAKVLNDILYAIKQMLRRVFGQRADVSKLNPNTTLEELTTMLVEGQKFIINTEVITDEDLIAYSRQRASELDDMNNLSNTDAQDLANAAYTTFSKNVKALKDNNQYDDLAVILKDQFKRSDLEQMKGDLAKYQTVIADVSNRVVRDLEYKTNQVTALLNVMGRLENVVEKMDAHLADIANSPETLDNLNKAYYYKDFIDSWEGFIEIAKAVLNDKKNNVPKNSPVLALVNSISTSLDRSKDTINDIYAESAKDALYTELEPMGRTIKARYDDIIKELKAKKAPQKDIDRWHKEFYGLTEADYNTMKQYEANKNNLSAEQKRIYENMRIENAKGLEISKTKIDSLLKGQAGDANYFNSYLEGYLYNSDPIIGGLALYVKNKLNEVMAISQAKFNDFNIDVEPYFKAAGVNENNIGELGTRIGFLDSVGRIVKAGEKGKENLEGTLEERKVWTLLSKFKGYRYAFDQLDHAVKLAQKAWGDSGSDTDRTLLIQAVANRAKESRAWMHQKYDDRYNKLDEIFEYDPPGEEGVGEEAIYRRDNALENINLLSGKSRNQSDELAMADQLDDLWAKYKQLYSLFNPDGTAKTGFERNVALRILRYQQESRDFHTFEPREGVFQNALRAYEQELIDDGNTVGDDVYNNRRTEWIKRNTRVKIKDEFYVRREEILDEIKEILSTLRDGDDIDMGILWEEVFKRTGEFRDDDGQLKGDQMSEITIAEVKALQEEMIVKQNNYKSRSGLTPNEQFELEELRRLKKQGPLSPTDKARMNVLFNALNTMGLSEAQSKRLDTLYEDLGELSRTEPTEYYVEKINSFLQNLNTDKVEAKIKSRLTSIGNVDKALTDSVLEDLFAQSPEFETWFKDNHIRKSVYNEKTRRKEPTWVRLYVWNITKPQDSSMLEVTEIKDENGVVTDIIEGVPNSKYFKRTVKPEYLTKEILGVTKDNKGNWLPKDIPGSPFLNEKYAALNAADKALLEKLTEHHLRNQEGLDRNSKLYLDFPRFSKSNLEVLQTQSVGKDKMTALTIWAQRFRNFFRDSAADNPQKGMNEDDKFNLVKVDMFDNNVTGVPIAGLYDMEYADVTTDIRHSMMRYMLSAERQKQLIAISPVVRAIQSVVKDPRNAVLPTTIDKRNFVGRTIEVFRGKKDKSIRAKAVDNFIEREFEGKALAGHTKDMAWVNNLQNKLFARASFGFFALNIPSALKNSFSAKFQGMIEASAGTYMNHKTFAQGEVDSIKTMTEISAQVYEHGPKSLHVQLVELMDPSQGRFEDKFGESGTRTLLKDTASMTWLYNFRKWTELQATLQTFFGMMHHKNDIEQTQPDGTVKKLDYVDVWEIKDGKIQLKPGIDPKWGITYDAMGVMNVGSEYKLMRNKIHQTMNNLQGSYAQFDQPEAQRYLGFRFLSFLKKYFVPMATNRWGFAGKWSDPRPRLNPGMADAQMGYYITFLKTLERTIKSLGQNLPSMTKPEKAAALKVLTETMALLVATLLMSLLFGWDPDDEDRFKKMRAKSGPLPFFPFTADDPTRPFNGWGFLENHALLLMMNVRAENESFLPFPGFGLEKYAEMMDLKSIAFQPTIKNYIAILRDMINIASRNDDAYYERAVGPYKWQQEGGTKMWAHFAQIAGMTGSTLEPFKGVKGIETTSKFR